MFVTIRIMLENSLMNCLIENTTVIYKVLLQMDNLWNIRDVIPCPFL